MSSFVTGFRALHEKAKNGTLTPAERATYRDARTQLERMLYVAQKMGDAGQTLRASLRMPKMLKLELTPDDGELMRLSTIDLASRGFAALIPSGLRVGREASFTLYLPSHSGSGTTPVMGRCVVASSRPQVSLFRVSFRFAALAPDVQELLEITLIDAVLERFTKA